MECLIREYAALLFAEGKASDKFWKLCKRTQEDKWNPGVLLSLRKHHMMYDVVAMVNDGAISFDDLNEFSDNLRETVQYLCSR